MVSFSELEEILNWTKSSGAKIVVRFKGTPYRLQIYKLFRAVDSQGRFVPWTRAFGTKQPHQLFDTFKVLEIRVIRQDGKEEKLTSFKQLLSMAKS